MTTRSSALLRGPSRPHVPNLGSSGPVFFDYLPADLGTTTVQRDFKRTGADDAQLEQGVPAQPF